MWRPTASTENLRVRAKLLTDCRRFFAERNVMEVDTPCLGANTVTDPHIDSFSLLENRRAWFLQTSPEFYMKRLLAAGTGDIYYLGKAFRQEELGAKHLREFTLLEWYRESFDIGALVQEVEALIQCVANDQTIVADRVTYRACFQRSTGLDPHTAETRELVEFARKQMDLDFSGMSRSGWLDLLFAEIVEPTLSDGLYIVVDYPVCQSALARIDRDARGTFVAKRFEVYWKGIELANGYWELLDPQEQRERFGADLSAREVLQKNPVTPDEHFLASLESGLPECSGVALGIDRLLMCLTGEKAISRVVSFTS